jgi:aspartate racemase
LENDGAKSFCITCVTAYACLDRITKEVTIPAVNLLSLTARIIADLGYKKVGVLCSNGSVISKVWEHYLNTEIVYPTNVFQDLLTEGICFMKKGNDAAAIDCYNRTIEHVENSLKMSEGGGILLGCMDIALLLEQIQIKAPVVNVIDILVEYICKCWIKHLESKQ